MCDRRVLGCVVNNETIPATLTSLWKRSESAGGLLVPYLAWVSFAAMLNVAISREHRHYGSQIVQWLL